MAKLNLNIKAKYVFRPLTPPFFHLKKSVSKMTLNGIKHIFSHYFLFFLV